MKQIDYLNLEILIAFISSLIILIKTFLLKDKYNIEKRKLDSNYKKDNFRLVFGKFGYGIDIPFKIVDSTPNVKLQAIIKDYNKKSNWFWRFFWLSMIVIILTYCMI